MSSGQNRWSKVDGVKSTKESRQRKVSSVISFFGIIIILLSCLVTTCRMSHELSNRWSTASNMDSKIDLPHEEKSAESMGGYQIESSHEEKSAESMSGHQIESSHEEKSAESMDGHQIGSSHEKKSAKAMDGHQMESSQEEKSAEAMDGANKKQQQTQTKPKKRRLNLIQIGANDGVEGNGKQVTKMLNNPDSKAILVEGSPSVFKLLTANVKAKYDPTLQRIAVLNALVCDQSEKRVFYSVDVPKMMKASTTENYTLPHWVEYQIASLDRSTTRANVNMFLNMLEGKNNFANITADDVIAEDMLDCVSFESLLSIAPFAPEEVDVLAIDVEGFDAPVLLESFKLPGLEPDLIIFEWRWTRRSFFKEFNEVMDTLSRKGYKLNCEKSESGHWGCNGGEQDVIARKSY